jgi:Amino acid synthesis
MIEVRKTWSQVETIHHEFGPAPEKPLVKGAVCAVVTNPFAGRYEPNLMPMMEALNSLGLRMANKLLADMFLTPLEIHSYGKGAIVGSAGEQEHGALWHVPGGYAMREVLGGKDERCHAIVPSAKKVGAPGTKLDVPMTHITASYVRSHFDSMEIYVPGAPKADELVFVLVMASGARVHARVGGLTPQDITAMDGLR